MCIDLINSLYQTKISFLFRKEIRAFVRAGFLLLVLSSLMLTCRGQASTPVDIPSSSPVSTLAKSTPAKPVIEVEVIEDPTTDSWFITYHLPYPANAISFARNRNLFRKDSWEIIDNSTSLRWEHMAGLEVVHTQRQSEQKTFSFRFKTDAKVKQKDYELNLPFSDGSRLLYTGHLDIEALTCTSKDHCERQFRNPRYQFLFRTKENRDIRLLDQHGRGTLQWSPAADAYGDGTYVYFGNIETLASKEMVALIDPGMPSWMVKKTKEVLPGLFTHYKEQTGVSLDFQPLIFASFVNSDKSGFSYGGGTLSGLIQLAAEGEKWQKQTEESEILWFRFLAHEVFHLWNGQMFSRRLGTEEEWLSEGSAEYFAFRALLESKVIDEKKFQSMIVNAANRCLTRLGGKPLLQSHLVGNFRNFYTCGAVLHFIVDQNLRASDKNLSTLFTQMFERATKRDKTYTTFDYLEFYRKLSDNPLLIGPITQVLYLGVPKEADRFFYEQLKEAGLDIALVDIPQADINPGGFSAAVATLLAGCDCGKNFSVSRRKDHLEFHALKTCNTFQKQMLVQSVAGHNVAKSPHLAYQEARRLFSKGKAVSLGLYESKKTIQMNCRHSDTIDTSFSKLLTLQN